jgi:hypothetical protein
MDFERKMYRLCSSAAIGFSLTKNNILVWFFLRGGDAQLKIPIDPTF